MSLPNSSLRTHTTIGHLYTHSIEQSTRQEDTLIEIQPQLHDSGHPLTPPTQGTFEFPSLLECLSDHTEKTKMPPQDFSSDIDDHSIFDQTESLSCENQSDTLSASSPLIAHHASDDHMQESTDDETDDGLQERWGLYNSSPGTSSRPFDAVIQTQRILYEDEIPPFCIRTPEQTEKKVQLAGGKGEAQISFRDWDDRFGYWVLTDKVKGTYIVKYTGGGYRVWTGMVTGFAKECIAYVLKPNDKKRARPASYQSDEECGETSTPKEGLRPRTARQSMPYTMYKIQKKYDNQGLRLTESELEKVAFGSNAASPVQRKTFKRLKRVSNSATNHHTDDLIPPLSSTPNRFPLSMVPDADILFMTTFRTRLHGFGIASIPLTGNNCPSNDTLFEAMSQKWAFKLASQKLAFCVATFPWLSADRNIILQEDDSDAFIAMLYEIRCVPDLKAMERIEVVIEIFVE